MLFESNILDLIKFLPSKKRELEKKQMRELLRQRRRIMTKDEVKEQSALVLEQLEQLPCFQQARSVLIYYPTHNEVNLLPLIKKYKREKTFLFPVVRGRQMQACPYEGNAKMHRGKYKIPEPTTAPYLGDIDLILAPGVAFDEKGNRLGQGGGYYDRFLAQGNKNATLVGVAYEFQIVEDIPVSRHDKKMHYVVYSGNVVCCAR